MRAFALSWSLAVFGFAFAAPPPNEAPGSAPAKVPGISAREAADFARFMMEAIGKVRMEYIRPMSEEKLAGVAIQSLFEVAGMPVPEQWRGDPATIMSGRDLLSELTRGRELAGKPPALQGSGAIRVSLEAIVRELDPYCAYVTAEELTRNPYNGPQIGLGIHVEERSGPGPLFVRTVVLDSPAQKADVRPGDQLLQINDEPTDALSAAQAVKRLDDGQLRTKVKLLVRSLAPPPANRSLELERAVLHEDSLLGVRRTGRDWTPFARNWDYLLDADQRIAYARLATLRRSNTDNGDGPGGTAGELEEALVHLRRSGLSGLVLDLRDCPRGYIDEATGIAELFLPANLPLATVRYRPPEQPRTHTSHGGDFTRLPLVVLIGPDTSGAGELIACALQDHGRAPIFGQRTRGKDTIQPADNGNYKILIGDTNHGLRLSIGQFLRPSGKNLGRLWDSKPWDDWGVQPDEGRDVQMTADLRRQIRRWRLAQDLRPPQSRATLPLDDPANDPVLFAGLQEVRRLIREKGKQEAKPAASNLR